MLVAYQEFVRADAPHGASVADAERRLAEFIAERVEGVLVVGARRRARRRWFEMPVFRYAAAAAVLVGVAVGVARWLGAPGPRDAVVLRGGPTIVLTVQARSIPGGGFELSWMPIAGADLYEVTMLAEDLSELVRFPASEGTRLTLDASEVPPGATAWQVSALEEGAVLVESTPEPLPE
jgi:hypothetical protein